MPLIDPVEWLIGKFTVVMVRLSGWGVSKLFSGSDRVIPSSGRPIDYLRNSSSQRREMRELQDLYGRLSQHAPNAEERCKNLCSRAVERAFSRHEDGLKRLLGEPAWRLCFDLLRYEGHFSIPNINLNRQLSISEMWELTATVSRQLMLFEQPEKQRQIETLLHEFLTSVISKQMRDQLAGGGAEEAMLFVPLYMLHAEIAGAIETIVRTTFHAPEKDGTFDRLGDKLSDNILLASGIDPDRQDVSHKEPVMPTAARDKSPSELVGAYLAATPFIDFFSSPYPFSIPLSHRFEHMHVVGGSGHGKTQLLQSFILRDLPKVSQGEGSIIVIDSQGDMLKKILRLASVGEMAERVVLIEPRDIDYPPALNLLDFGLDRINHYNAADREMLLNGAIALYEYVFGALLGAELTQRQGVIFRYLARLLMFVPGATIHTLIEFMQNPEAAKPHVVKLEGTARRFFDTQFFSDAFDTTRQQILTRLYGVLSNNVLDRMFTNERNKLNLFEAMNSGSLILINTAKDLLKQEGSEILGRFFIVLICQAAQERASIPEHQRQNTFVYIDEAHDYFDESMENLLNQARKYRVGLVLAHQNLDQFEQKLRATVMASTAIKAVGGLSAKDASQFAREMRCQPEFLHGMRKHQSHTEFACFIRNHTPSLVTLPVPFGQLEDQAKIHPAALVDLLQRNRSRYCATNGNHSDAPTSEDSSLEEQELI